MNNINLDSKRVRQYDRMKTIILPPFKTDNIIIYKNYITKRVLTIYCMAE